MSCLEEVTVRDFRNLAHLTLEVPRAGLVVIGDNGHGKTNLLEAIAYLHALRSVRGARDADLVRFGEGAFHIAARCAEAPCSEVRVGFERATRRKRVTLDGAPTSRLTDGLGALPSVTIAPRDVELVLGAPSVRRRYLDVLLALSSRRYLGALQNYRAALQRRNATIRNATARRDSAEFDAQVAAWEGPLATHGAVLAFARKSWVEAVASRYAALCASLGERSVAGLRYRVSVESSLGHATSEEALEAELRSALAAHRAIDCRRGATMVGPHRDDLDLRLGGRLLRTFGSAGQQRSAAMALRVLEAESLERQTGYRPVLLLDDPFAELDRDRARRVLDLLEGHVATQVILAVPRADDVPGAFTGLSRVSMQDGVVCAWTGALDA
ncbi:MAG: DNA replication and repair protein RecF [Gemmatimonadaceae bacterium]